MNLWFFFWLKYSESLILTVQNAVLMEKKLSYETVLEISSPLHGPFEQIPRYIKCPQSDTRDNV